MIVDLTPITYKSTERLKSFRKSVLPDLQAKFYNHLHLFQSDIPDRWNDYYLIAQAFNLLPFQYPFYLCLIEIKIHLYRSPHH